MNYVKPIAVSLLLMLALTAGIAMGATTASTQVTGSIASSYSITAPESADFGAMIRGEPRPTSTSSVTYTADVPIDIKFSLSDSGYMKKVGNTKTLKNLFVITPSGGSPLTGAGPVTAFANNAVGSSVAKSLTYTQLVDASDEPGSYAITVTWTIAPVP